ncbi:uncharacterized protein LOC126374412 [Pectinophora gossypiella]|nr:uncharacterized protein LOC126374412 [Pectinophora gossypiella]
MKLLVAVALLAVAAAAPDLRQEQGREEVQVATAFNSVGVPDAAPVESAPVAAAAESVAVVDGDLNRPEPIRIAEPSLKSDDGMTVKVVSLPNLNEQADFVKIQVPDFMLPDISPMIISPEVMRQVAEMAAHDSAAVNIGEANPFAFNNAEPLETIEPVKVVDSPVNELTAQMEPVMVVETSANDEPGSFDISPQPLQLAIPEELKQYLENPKGQIPAGFKPIPVEYLRDAPQLSGYRPPRRDPYLRSSGVFDQEMRPNSEEMLRGPIPHQFGDMPREPHFQGPLDPQFHNYPFRMHNNPMLR